MREEEKRYWNKRAETYGKLDDIKSKRTAYKIVNQIKQFNLNRNAHILDVGCGEGLITRVIRDNLRDSFVVGIDISEKMIQSARRLERDTLRFYVEDFFNLSVSKTYKLITMNLVLHHLTEGRDLEALLRANHFLDDNGWILVSEAVPPEDEIYEYYMDIFSLKEHRNCYLKSDLAKMLRMVGFNSVRSSTFRFNIRLNSWLNDHTISAQRKKLLYDMHVNGSDKFKEAYKMVPLGGGDYALSCKMAIVFGRK